MIYSGIIKGENNKELSNAFVNVLQGDAVIATIHADQYGYWQIDTDTDSGLLEPGKLLSFCATGYPCYNIAANIIPATFDVDLSKTKSFVPYLIGGAALAIVAMNAGKKKKKVGAISTNEVTVAIYIAGGLIGFTILKSTLEKFGIWKSAATRAIDQLNASSNNFWSPNYWQQINPNGLPYQNALTEDQAMDYLHTIHNAFGILTDDREAVTGVFKALKTKANASWLAYINQKNYGSDLLTFLRNGGGVLPWDGLSDADIVAITNYINSLPNF